ncbi:hypothetical protein NDU88_002315 [Pleurodeles waltl]|uniref:Uncharacterized protein n=1 Tax=Pleurodeles waltl TaxID=8319 RepID=A0AAV7UVC4_PLEWA|nr:hypothetical protein NDU88_002315 [Pleurodeles waltl]
MEPSKVVMVLKVLQDEGREDLIKEGVLEEAWVGVRRLKRRSAEGVSATVAACSSPKSGKTFVKKSVEGRKVSCSPDLGAVDNASLPSVSSAMSRGRRGVYLPRRRGSSFSRRVSSGGRGAQSRPAVASAGRLGARAKGAHAQLRARSQARSPLERGVEQDLCNTEERTLAGARKMAVPSMLSQSMPVVKEKIVGKPDMVVNPGEQVELVDNREAVFNGIVCSEAGVSGASGKAYVSLDLWQPNSGEGTSGCDTSHGLGGHGVQAIYRQSGRIVGDQSLTVKVRAPSEHRHEGRVRSGAVHLTSREAAGPVEAQPSTSRSTGADWDALDEELLDYEDEVEVPVMSKKRVVVAGEVPGVVQGGHVPDHHQERSAGSLPRGEEGFVGFSRRHDGGDNSGNLSRANVSNVTRGSREFQSKVDASIQVSAVTETEGKKEVSGGNGDESLEKDESGEGGKSGALFRVGMWR